MKLKYGVKNNITGVYLITNKLNGKRYVGASNNVSGRMSQHMRKKVAEKYEHLEFYKDVLKYGYQGFEFKLLEECTKEDKLNKEKYWYDKLKPEYNTVRPNDDMLNHPIVKKRSIEKSQDKEHVEYRKKLYNSKKYIEHFRTCRVDKMKPIDMYKNDVKIKTFISIRSTARWLDDNTSFKSKNKASKVKAVCDGERNNAFGFKFKYSTESVETILKKSKDSIDTNSEAVNRIG